MRHRPDWVCLFLMLLNVWNKLVARRRSVRSFELASLPEPSPAPPPIAFLQFCRLLNPLRTQTRPRWTKSDQPIQSADSIVKHYKRLFDSASHQPPSLQLNKGTG